METGITMVRLYIPEMTHSTRKALFEKVLRLLRAQSHVHGVMVVSCVRDGGTDHELHYETVGDILRRNPDPPLILEFFDEEPDATGVRRLLHELAPESLIAYWQANLDNAASKRVGPRATTSGTINTEARRL